MKLCKKLKIFLSFLPYFVTLNLIANISKKKMSIIAYAFPKL